MSWVKQGGLWTPNRNTVPPELQNIWDSFVAFYPLNEGGEIVRNVIPGGGIGTLDVGSGGAKPTWGAEERGLGLTGDTAGGGTFQGKVIVSDLLLGDSFAPEQLTLMYFGLWSDGNDPRVISKQSSSDLADTDWQLGENNSGTKGVLRFRLGAGGTNVSLQGSAAYEMDPATEGVFVCLYDGATMRLWDSNFGLYTDTAAQTGTVDATAGRPIALLNSGQSGANRPWGQPVYWVAIGTRSLEVPELEAIGRNPTGFVTRAHRVPVYVELIEAAEEAADLVNNDLTLQFDIQEFVSDDLALQWDMAGIVSDDLALQWDMAELVSDDLQLIFDIAGLVNDDLQLIWDMAAFVNDDLQLLWDMAGMVSDDLKLQFGMAQLVGQNLTLQFDILTLVNDDLQIQWDMAELANDDLQLIFDIAGLVNDDLQLIYDMAGTVSRDLDLRWDIEVDVEATGGNRTLNRRRRLLLK